MNFNTNRKKTIACGNNVKKIIKYSYVLNWLLHRDYINLSLGYIYIIGMDKQCKVVMHIQNRWEGAGPMDNRNENINKGSHTV